MTEQRKPDEKIIERLRKLLALAKDKGANEHEASLAMQRAQDIMTEYNLTVSEVGGASGGGVKREKSVVRGAMYEWQRKLMAAIAEINFCFHRVTQTFEWNEKTMRRRKRNVHELIGSEANVMACRVMFEYLYETIERLLPVENNAERLSRWAVSWREGCADRLRERLEERKRALEEESRKKAAEERARQSHPAYAGSGALVVVLEDVYERERNLNRDFRLGLEPGTTERQLQEYRAREKDEVRMWEEREAKQKAEREAKLAAMTDKERERFLRKEEEQRLKDQRRSERYWDARYNEQRRKEARKDRSAIRAGREAGEKIGLDTQIDKSAPRKAIK